MKSSSIIGVSVPPRLVTMPLQTLASFSLFTTLALSGCTFYTGEPRANPSPTPSTSGATASGGSGSDGNSSGGGTTSTGDGGDAGADQNLPDWVDITGDLVGRSNSGGDVVLVSAKPDDPMLIAGIASDGLWASTNGGKNWKALGQTGASDLISNRENSVVYDPDDSNVFWETGIYVGGGLYHTEDNGKTILELGTGVVHHNDLVSIDFSDPKRQTLLVGGHEQKQMLYLSTDAGANFSLVGDAIPMDTGFSSWPLIIDSQTFLCGVSNQIVRSTDGGASWTSVSKAGGWGAPIQSTDGSIYWLVEDYFGVMRSDDQGETWNRAVGNGIVEGMLVALPDGAIASQTYTNVIVSRDQGVTWKVVSSAFPFPPKGLTYSKALKAFLIWTDSTELQIPDRSIMRYNWDYEAE